MVETARVFSCVLDFEDQMMHFISKVRTFVRSEGILAPHHIKGSLEDYGLDSG